MLVWITCEYCLAWASLPFGWASLASAVRESLIAEFSRNAKGCSRPYKPALPARNLLITGDPVSRAALVFWGQGARQMPLTFHDRAPLEKVRRLADGRIAAVAKFAAADATHMPVLRSGVPISPL